MSIEERIPTVAYLHRRTGQPRKTPTRGAPSDYDKLVLRRDALALIDDYEEVLEDKRRLTRELAVLLDGPNAAPNPSLCDIVSNVAAAKREYDAELAAHAAGVEVPEVPIPMVLYCPNCGTQHIDAPEPAAYRQEPLKSLWDIGNQFGAHRTVEANPERWRNPPHRSHLCHRCGVIWRPADVATTGVRAIATRGKRDAWPYDGSRAAALAPSAEPRNVDGMTRVEFEHSIRIGYQYDNVRGNVNAPTFAATAEQERDIAARVERNYPSAPPLTKGKL